MDVDRPGGEISLGTLTQESSLKSFPKDLKTEGFMFLRLILILQEVSRQKRIGYLEPARNSPGKLFFFNLQGSL